MFNFLFISQEFDTEAFRHYRFWYTKLYALTDIQDFEGLEVFSRPKRAPVGYEVLVRHLLSKGYKKQAIGFVLKCDMPKRVDLYVECDEWLLAAKACKDLKDRAKIE